MLSGRETGRLSSFLFSFLYLTPVSPPFSYPNAFNKLFLAAGRYVAAIISLPNVDPLFDSRLVVWIPLFFGSSFATNCIVTILIAYRLITAGKRVSAGGSNPYWRTIAIIAVRIYFTMYLIITILKMFCFRNPARSIWLPIS